MPAEFTDHDAQLTVFRRRLRCDLFELFNHGEPQMQICR
jgi:hypothetical protein